MSKVVDERVVEMRFDNKQFESNVQTSMSTLEKLKQRLNLKGAAKGLDEVNTAAKKTDFSVMSNGVETVQAKFSAMQVVAMTALANITNSAINAGKRIVSALTIDPITTGFQEYETQINAVQTILANTQKEGTTVKDVNAALDELNTYADKTIYNFTEMTRNIGTFTAAGVKLDTSVNAIQGIANLAAVSGSTSQQASTAMYQLSQALASGTVKLMDWNSVVNAGMGGQVFQDALKETSEALGTGAEAAIAANGSFRESLQTGWLTSEVLTETLKKFTTSGATEYVAKYTGLSTDAVQAALDAAEAQYGEADAIEYASKALAEKTGKNADEIKSALEFARTAEDAATKVKTMTQLWDTLKEAAQSGWSQTWRLLVGDFEEAKELFTYLSDTISEVINRSSEARNAVIKSFVDLGGRTDLVDALKNTLEGVGRIVKPISEAFREIFPPITAKQLKSFSEGLKELTSHLKISDKTASKIKSTFTGLFSIIDIGVSAVKNVAKGIFTLLSHVTGLSGGLLTVSAGIGDFLSKLRDGVKDADVFGKVVDKIVGFLVNCIDKIKEFGSSIRENLKFPEFDGVLSFFKAIGSLTKDVASGLGKAFSSTGSSITEFLGKVDIGGVMELLNGGLFAGLLIALKKFVKGLTNPTEELGNFFETLKETVTGSFEKVTGILDDVRGSLEAYQNNLKAGTLLKIAAAVGILAVALTVLSTIDEDKLSVSLGAIAGIFGELIASMAIMEKINGNATKPLAGLVGSLSNISKTIQMAGLAVSVLILAGAMKTLASLDWAGIKKGLVGIAGMVGVLVAAAKLMESESKSVTKFAGQMVILSFAVLALSHVAKSLSAMSWEELGKAGAGLLGIISMLVAAAKIMNSESKSITKFAGQMVIMSVAVGMMSLVAKNLSSMSWEELGKAGAGMLGIITIFVASAKIMNSESKSITKFSGQMILMSAAIGALSLVGKMIASMSWEELGKAGAGILGLVTMLVAAAKVMDSNYKSVTKFAGQMLLMSASLALLAPVLQKLGSMSLESIMKSLVAMGGAFFTLGIAAMALQPLIPAILGLAAALALLGVAAIGIGAGLTLIGVGLTSIAAAGTAAAASLVASLGIIVTGLVGLIPAIMNGLGEAIVAFCQLIGQVAPQIADAFLQLISSTLASLAEYTPQIADSLFTLLIGVMNVLTERAPELLGSLVILVVALINGLALYIPDFIDAGINLVGEILQGIVDAIGPIMNEIIVPLLGVIQGLIVGIAEAIAPYIPTICDAFTTMTQVICDAIVRITEILAPFIPQIQVIVVAISAAVQAICNAFITLVSQIAPIINSITSLVKQLGDSISQVLKSVADTIQTCGDTISQVLSSIADTINSVFSGIADVITSIGDSIKSVLDGIAGVIESIGQAALDAGTGFDRLASGVKKITELNLVDMVASMTAVASGIKDIASSSEGLASAGTGMQQIANGTTLSATAFNTMAIGITSIVGKLTTIGPIATTAMSTMVSSVTSSASCFTTLSTTAVTAMSTMNAIIVRAISMIVSRRSQFMALGRQLMLMFSNGMKAGSSGISISITLVLSRCVSAIRLYYNSFNQAGKYLGQGLVDGIKSKETAAYNAGYKLGQKAVQGEKDGQQSNSPSKLTKKAGRWLGEGLVIGIEQMGKAVYQSGKSMGENAVESISGALSRVSDIANNDFDVMPSITPVVDLDELQNGSRYLSIGADLSSRLLSGPVNSLQQIVTDAQNEINASNNEVIRAINGLREDLNTLYNADDQEIALYVDSKKLASSIAKPMNRQLNILSKRGAY